MSRYLLIFVLLFSNVIIAQRKFNSFSLETAFGIHAPVSSQQGIKGSDYIGFKNLNLGVRYMFHERFGVKINYTYNRFENRFDNKFGNTFQRVGIEGVVNLSKVFNHSYRPMNEHVLLLHGGVGITYAYPDVLKKYQNTNVFSFELMPDKNFDRMYERIGNLSIGCTYLYKLSRSFALSIDGSYVVSYVSQYNYDGELLYENYKKINGKHMSFSVGIQFYIGKRRSHADWYFR